MNEANSSGAAYVTLEQRRDSRFDKHQSTEMTESPMIDPRHHRYPHCIVWTPIPLLT
jgi:hypothetical protein